MDWIDPIFQGRDAPEKFDNSITSAVWTIFFIVLFQRYFRKERKMCEEQKKTSRKKCNTLTTIYEHLLYWNAWKRIVAHNKTTPILTQTRLKMLFRSHIANQILLCTKKVFYKPAAPLVTKKATKKQILHICRTAIAKEIAVKNEWNSKKRSAYALTTCTYPAVQALRWKSLLVVKRQ